MLPRAGHRHRRGSRATSLAALCPLVLIAGALLVAHAATPAHAACGLRIEDGVGGNMSGPAICEGGSGTFLPAFNKVGEANWPTALKVILYLVGLLWTFSGIGIITDVFMEAIEIITSEEKEVKVEQDGETHTVFVQVWNPTIANLSLMALGSSAPEIILSVIEIVTNDFFAGALGPSTIVGSAAFNLLVIIAVCVMAIPKGETRRLQDFGVFLVTAVFSLFAYLWLIVILVAISPNVVELWEGIVTLLFFPVLLGMSYYADRGKCGFMRRKPKEEEVIAMQELGKKPVVFHHNYDSETILREVARAGSVSNEDKANFIAASRMDPDKKSRAWYRINATRQLTGSSAIMPDYTKAQGQKDAIEGALFGAELDVVAGKNFFHFKSTKIACVESDGSVQVTILRVGNVDSPASVAYYTESHTATKGEDFAETKGVAEFAAGEKEKTISIKIHDDDEAEDDEIFFFHLHNPSEGFVVHPTRSRCDILIIDDDRPGYIEFEYGSTSCKESVGTIFLSVVRKNGSKGELSVDYFTRDGTAHAPHDYKEAKGTLVFADGELEKSVALDIVNDDLYEADEYFTIELTSPDDSAELGIKKSCRITIINEDKITSIAEKVQSLLNINMHKYRVGGKTWKEQFSDALEWPEEGGVLAGFMHIINIPWKLLAACIPPTLFAGGWMTFCVALIVIGIVTAIIGDLASLMGCSMGLKDTVTAITFVALGTSLPDTFASKSAAVASKTADAAVTNVTGSNSVNVFLGLGLSWAIASIYWTAVGKASQWVNTVPTCINDGYSGAVFWVPAGDLAFSVIVFSVCCVLCILTLLLRRFALGYELGGRYTKATAGFFLFLWLLYVLLSSFKAYEYF